MAEDVGNVEKLIREIAHNKSAPATRSPCRLMIPQVTDRYVATAVFVEEMGERLATAEKLKHQGRFAIFGMGGAGKTSPATYYIHQAQQFDTVLWFQSKSKATLDSGFANSSWALGLTSGSETSARCVEALQDYLRTTNSMYSTNLPFHRTNSNSLTLIKI